MSVSSVCFLLSFNGQIEPWTIKTITPPYSQKQGTGNREVKRRIPRNKSGNSP